MYLCSANIEFDEATKSNLTMLKQALQEKAGLVNYLLVASKSFNQRSQGPEEKVKDYASELKHLFKQPYRGEAMDSIVLLQKFLTCQVLKPENLHSCSC